MSSPVTLPSLVLSLICSLLIGALFHLWVDGGVGRLILYLVLSIAGFIAGQWFGDWRNWLLLPIGPLNLGLASLGIYGVISYSVTRQTHEIGIRMALGATPARVQLGVITKTIRLALVGMALGTMASFAVGRWIASLLFGTTPTDLATFAGMILLLSAVALVAGYIPARRASRIEPVIALRSN